RRDPVGRRTRAGARHGPRHRVVRSGGLVGGRGCGDDRRRWLLGARPGRRRPSNGAPDPVVNRMGKGAHVGSAEVGSSPGFVDPDSLAEAGARGARAVPADRRWDVWEPTPVGATVIIEPDPGGHRFQAVANVARVAARSGPVVLLTSDVAVADPAFKVLLGDLEVALEVEQPFT